MKNAIWIMALAFVGLITAVAQLDRQSRYAADWAEHVPGPARFFAQDQIVRKSLRRDERDLALADAEILVARRPLPAEHLRRLAQARFAVGDEAGGLNAIQLAARRGWRDRITQESMAQIAILADDPGEAATRIAALYARQSDGSLHRALAQPVLSDSRGQDRMAEILAGPARWNATFLRQSVGDLDRSTLNTILLKAHANGAELSCAHLGHIVTHQAREDRLPEDRSELAPLIARNCK